MKVALIGNMNNNNFSIMRYLRDLGVDAHLILMKNDYTKSQAHFTPENDTWEIEKWKPYIHYLNYYDWEGILFRSGKSIKNDFKEYDILIGSGYIPVLLSKSKIFLDIFYPYTAGVEGVTDALVEEVTGLNSLVNKLFFIFFRNSQIKAIKKAKVCLSSEIILTKKTFDDIGVEFKNISIPMVYNKEKIELDKTPDYLKSIINTILKYKYRFLCHVSHMYYKDNEPYITGFAKFMKANTGCNSVLILFDYGTGVDKTKSLINVLGIVDNVIWLQTTSRKNILQLLNNIDFGFSEFEGIMWGGTGWEFLSKGVPFFHYYNISPEKFQEEYGIPIPLFINTNSSDEICNHLTRYIQDTEPYKKTSNELKEWFEQYGGIGLAKEWRDIILELYKAK